MILKKLLMACVLAGSLFCAGIASGATEDADVTITKTYRSGVINKRVTWFSAYDVGGSTGTAYDYNDQQEATDADGLVDCMYYTDKTIQIDVILKGSTSIEVRIEGRANSAAEWGEIYTKSFTAVTGANNAKIVNIQEHIDEVRVGVKVSGTPGTDSITITGSFYGR